MLSHVYSWYRNDPSGNVEPKLVEKVYLARWRKNTAQKTHVLCVAMLRRISTEKMEDGEGERYNTDGNYP